MTKLYSQLAQVYHEMYQSIFDYQRDYRRWHAILKRHGCKRVLEIGCGTGNLAPYFLKHGYNYTGMDIAAAMLRIARREVPTARFERGDMRWFSSGTKFDAVVIGGRSFAYMTTNADVRCALACIRKALKPGGLLAFDNFDAKAIFGNFKKRVSDKIVQGNKTFVRHSSLSMNLQTGWTWNWDAVYAVQEGGKKKTYRDRSVLRAFTGDELKLFLELAGFTTLRLTREPNTIFVMARRN